MESRIKDLEETIAIHGREFSANHSLIYSLIGRIDEQAKRIERLEEIVVGLAGGSETGGPYGWTHHIHFVRPASGAKDLVEEIKVEHQGSNNDASAKAEDHRCSRCEGPLGYVPLSLGTPPVRDGRVWLRSYSYLCRGCEIKLGYVEVQ